MLHTMHQITYYHILIENLFYETQQLPSSVHSQIGIKLSVYILHM